MRILFADRLPDRTIHDLEAHGHECVMEPGLGADDLAERIGGYDVLVVRGTQVRRPVIEAAEQTVLQRSIPFERQGRVFGFAQLVENAASPLTAFLMAPIAEAVFMPLMTDGRGADWIGGWFGTGPERGLALMFTLAGLFGVVVTVGGVAGASSFSPRAARFTGL